MDENKNPFGEETKNKSIAEQLAAPFETIGADGKIYPAHKWKGNTYKGDKVLCVSYIDARQAINRLNQVLGVDGWSNNLIEMSGKGLICELILSIDGKEVSKSNVGVESDYAKEKGQASDAIKRACVNFGVGAYLYEMQPVALKWTKVNGKKYPTTDKGQALITGDDLTSYINMLNPFRQKLSEIYMSIPEKDRPQIDQEFKKIWKVLTN